MEKVVVLMSTYNGEKFLEEQIESIINQENVKVELIVRDDGSSDSTKEILKFYEEKKCLKFYDGKNLNCAYSFMNLINNAPHERYYALADQDDVWKKDKLYKAINMIENEKLIDKPILYCSNYQLVDQDLKLLKNNNHVSTVTFNAALVSSCCTGCTVVFNKALLDILKIESPQIMLMHDDWIHKVCLAVGGKVIYDNDRTIYYRQHGSNVDGGVHTINNRIKKIFERIKNKDCIRSRQIAELVRIYAEYMNKENLFLANEIAFYKGKSFLKRFLLVMNKKIRTPYKKLNRGYIVAILLKYF